MSPSTWRLADLFAKHHFLLSGLGWGGMPLHAVQQDLDAGRLAALSIEDVPPGGFVSLTLVLGVFLFADGVATILLGFATRDWGSHNWVWMLLNGVLDLVLGVAIFAFLPLAAAWVVGTLVGIDLIFGGAALLAMVSSVKAD